MSIEGHEKHPNIQSFADQMKTEAEKELAAEERAAYRVKSMPIPMISFSIERMKETITFALGAYTDQLSELLQGAIDDYCTPENLAYIIETEARQVLDRVIREEVRDWFMYGEGRKTIKAAIEKKLRDGDTLTPLDGRE